MRREVKTQLLQMLQTLLEAHREIRRQIEKQQYDAAFQMLADCQASAIAIGTEIERTEQDQEAIVRCLEDYCDALYAMCEKIDRQETDKLTKHISVFNQHITNAYQMVDRRIQVILKMAFLPYKAAMWTSLASIWEAAAADPCCEAKVVVIPYYELDAYGNKTKLVYEGDQFPAEVPVVPYQEYDVAEERPDVIFIHNPYDEFNNVTRVPEQYYSYNLKPHTGKLVYSPYGLMGYYSPKQGAFMCRTSAVHHADYIIVQSERVKQIYMGHGVNGKKLIALGSPKVDAIVKLKNQKPEMPPEWKEKLEGRKVFLLNTHMSYFIQGHIYQQKYPERGNYTLAAHEDAFDRLLDRAGRALIWRPHPLLIPMLESRGLFDLAQIIKGFEQRVQDASNGVLDKNGSYDLAFQASDVLVTTYSSIVPEYLITGKPVYIFQARLNQNYMKQSPVDYSHVIFVERGRDVFQEVIDMVLADEDPLCKERMADTHKAFSNLEGTIGQTIYHRLKNSM